MQEHVPGLVQGQETKDVGVGGGQEVRNIKIVTVHLQIISHVLAQASVHR